MHTIRTQAINGGRTAIAGISLGANEKESSVIVMADKFGIVANANDSNVKQVFSVANGQVGIRGDLVVAGSVTRDKLSSGGGGNLLDNPIFANDAYGWGENRGNGALARQTTSLVRRMSSKFSGLITNSSVMIAEVRANSAVSSWWQVATQTVSVAPGRRYCFSAYMDAWACTGELMIQEIASDGKSWVRDFAFSGKKGRSIAGYTQSGVLDEGSGSIQSSTRSHVFFTAPSSGYVSVSCIMRDIKSASVLKIALPMLEECTEHTTEPSSWQNAGVTEMHGGSIIANTIRGDHIQANQTLRAPTIQGGQLNIGNGNFVVDSNGNLTARSGTFSGNLSGAKGTFSGDITGASGTFSGNVYAKNIKGDLVEPFIINAPKGVGEITVPAADYKRTLLVIPYSITASYYGNGKNNQLTYNVLMDDQVIATGTAFNGDNTIGTGSAILAAGRTVKLSMHKTGDGIFNPQIYILALRSS